MDIIPYVYFVAGIFLGGISFYFLLQLLLDVNAMLPVSSPYFNAMMSIFTFIPAIILFRSGIKLIMHMQKKRF